MSGGSPIRCHANIMPLRRPGESKAFALSKASISMFSALSVASSSALTSWRIASSVPELGIPPTWYGQIRLCWFRNTATGCKMRPSQVLRRTSSSMSGRISESVILLGFFGSRHSSRACQLRGTWRASHMTLRMWWRCCRIGVGVACSTLIVRPDGPGDLVPHLLSTELRNVSNEIGVEVSVCRACRWCGVALNLKLSKYTSACVRCRRSRECVKVGWVLRHVPSKRLFLICSPCLLLSFIWDVEIHGWQLKWCVKWLMVALWASFGRGLIILSEVTVVEKRGVESFSRIHVITFFSLPSDRAFSCAFTLVLIALRISF